MRLNITIPVYNEEHRLARSVPVVHQFMETHLTEFDGITEYEIVIANNGSSDQTENVAKHLAKTYPHLRSITTTKAGKGGAIRTAWQRSTADVLSYMDVDLSADISYFPTLIGAVMSGRSHIAIGSRVLPESIITRSFKREFISRTYMTLVRSLFNSRISDAHCGFKAISRSTAEALLPAVQDTEWFFDTELLIVAEMAGYSITELPLAWKEDADSRVKLFPTIFHNLKGLARLYKHQKTEKIPEGVSLN